MALGPTLVAAIFPANPVRGLRGGETWHVDSVVRDIATIHRLTSDAFSFSLEGTNSFDGPGFSASIVFIHAGTFTIDQSGHRRLLSAGDIFVACAWRPMIIEGSDDLAASIIALPGWWALQRFMDGFLILPDLYVAKDYFAAPIITDLAQTLAAFSGDDDTGAAQALTMLADLMRTALVSCVDPSSASPRWQGRMGAILEFIMRHLDTPGLSAQDAASSLKCSVRTIHKTCADYGTSFNAFLNEIRLVTAQHQLLRTDDRVSQIAYSVGFSSLSHFSHLFRARFGVAATAMRRSRATRHRP